MLAGCATPEPATPTTEPQIATIQHQWPLVKRRMERPVRTTVPDARSPHEEQIARNVTAILRVQPLHRRFPRHSGGAEHDVRWPLPDARRDGQGAMARDA